MVTFYLPSQPVRQENEAKEEKARTEATVFTVERKGNGVLEYWSDGVLEDWSNGVME
jgi:hypothetical protein